jgi:phosphosulfolactate synthase (CoM biosynthesis protein A)
LSKRLIAALFGVLAIALVGGCGGGDDSGSTGGEGSDSGSSLTKAEFIKQADKICEEGNESINNEAEEFAEENEIDTENPTTAEQEEVVSDVVAPGIRDQAEKISDLGAPSGEEDEVTAIIEAVEGGADEVEASPETIVEGTGAGPFEEANELANEYGLKVCGGE